MSCTTVKLERSDPGQPWGFRIHGGVDFNQPLLILKVTAGSLSATQGLVPGDQIILINGEDALRLRHKEAQQKIINSGNKVLFEVIRGDSGNLDRVLVQNSSNEPLPGRISRQNSVKQVNSSVKMSSTSTKTTISSSSSSVVNQTSVSAPTVVTQGWKPKYSEENIKEMMTSQAQVLDTGAIGVNFMKNDEKNFEGKKSEVLKMLHELEEEQKRKAQNLANMVAGAGTIGAEGGAQLQSAIHQQSLNSTFGILMTRNYEAALQAQQSQAPWATPQHSPAVPLTAEPVQ